MPRMVQLQIQQRTTLEFSDEYHQVLANEKRTGRFFN